MILQNSRTIPGQKALFFQDQGQIFPDLCEPVRACLILYAKTPKFNLWIYVVVMECRSLFSSTVTLILESVLEKMPPQQIAYFMLPVGWFKYGQLKII